MLTTKHRQFGQNLRALPYRSYNKLIVFVPGYYENVARPTTTRGDREGVSPEEETESATCPMLMRSDPNMEMDTNEEVINTNIISSPPVPDFVGQTDPHLTQSTIPAVSFHMGLMVHLLEYLVL